MKTYIGFFIMLMLATSTACVGKTKNKKTPSSGKKENSYTPINESDFGSFYASLKTLTLPLAVTPGVQDTISLMPLPDYLSFLFFDSISVYSQPRIGKLPVYANFNIVMIAYRDCYGNDKKELCILSPEKEKTDKLQLVSTEKVKDTSLIILQYFIIDNEYKIRVYKQLDTVLIEQLDYHITDAGHFEEIRDGNTSTIAYETFDDIHYSVEKFIWDYNSRGGLIRKNIVKSTYKITEDGNFIEF